MVLPIWQLALLQGYSPRVAESGLGLIADYPWSAPYEDLKVKPKVILQRTLTSFCKLRSPGGMGPRRPQLVNDTSPT